MALGVLNNISAVYAQNNLATTQSSLQKTLQQLSSGSRINSGADDAAGLSLANGLQASATALSQSAKNASQGVDLLQVADGALSQVTSLLNRGVTLATEASNGTLNSSQRAAADAEYQKILGEIDTINGTTKYNGINVFRQSSGATTGVAIYTSDGSALGATTYNNATTDLVATDTKSLGVANGVTFTGGFLDITGAANPGAATVAGNLMDSAGAAHSVDIAFTKVAGDANTWTYATTKHAGDTATSISGGNGAVTFDGKGSVVSFTGSPVTLSGIAGASDLTFTLDLGSLKQGVAADQLQPPILRRSSARARRRRPSIKSPTRLPWWPRLAVRPAPTSIRCPRWAT
jgi:flagellin